MPPSCQVGTRIPPIQDSRRRDHGSSSAFPPQLSGCEKFGRQSQLRKTKATTTTSHTTAFCWTYEGLEQNCNKWGVGYAKFYSMRQAQFCLLNCLAGNGALTNQPFVGPSDEVYSYQQPEI